MPGPEMSCLMTSLVTVAFPPGTGVLAYTGPGVGLELTPYFLGLVAWVALALVAVLLWPAVALIRRLRKPRAEPNPELTPAPPPEPPQQTNPGSS